MHWSSASAGPEFEVVAVNIDTRDADKPKAWLKDVGVQKLAYYADPTARTFQDLKSVGRAFGMPTTLLVDGAGLRNRHDRGTCRMGERRRHQADQGGTRPISASRPLSSTYAVILRFCPTPAATLARLARFCWAASST